MKLGPVLTIPTSLLLRRNVSGCASARSTATLLDSKQLSSKIIQCIFHGSILDSENSSRFLAIDIIS